MDAIETICHELGYSDSSGLFATVDTPQSMSQQDWINKGDWLLTAAKAGVDRIFFVANNPVVVFAHCKDDNESVIDAYNRIWCMARPRILFLVTDGKLSVIDLAQPPIHQGHKTSTVTTLDRLESIKDVAHKLQHYHRDNIESGSIFGDKRFGGLENRADQALISDLKTVRRALLTAKLDYVYAHALIGRSIFIRYLEDRKILTKEYFDKIACKNDAWRASLDNPTKREHLDFSENNAFYPRVLSNKAFSYALFRELAQDFNGDMFPNTTDEELHVSQEHLSLIQSLLYGDIDTQQRLFFFSYRFDIIPIDLISAIYEEFYHSTSDDDEKRVKARQDGAFYTPPALAEFVLSRVLTKEKLRRNPRVLDPACGSGIFLVEAFRRIIRYRVHSGEAISFDSLKTILANQIAGIEVNSEAARITAFSLYLAMLNYLDPPSIMDYIKRGNRLPKLVIEKCENAVQQNHIFVNNTFEIDANIIGKVDIIVGNPPWGAPGTHADDKTKKRQKIMLDWCTDREYPIGDKEPSQAFLWRVLDFMAPEGVCGLLTSAGVLFKINSTTKKFRKEWMKTVCIREVFNFVHIRHSFFKGAVSPFILIQFEKHLQGQTPVEYWAPKQVIAQKKTQAVFISKYDRNILVNQELSDNYTWKINWFGRHSDTVFISDLTRRPRIRDISKIKSSGRGYESCGTSHSADELNVKRAIRDFTSYGSLPAFFNPPEFLHRLGCQNAYIGKKIIIREGIQESGKVKGQIVARFEDSDFAFYRSIYGLKFKRDDIRLYRCILGILWSSFARYYFFNTSAYWGIWNHKLLLEELLYFPIPENLDNQKVETICSIVMSLQQLTQAQTELLVLSQQCDEEEYWEQRLDDAVFDLYDFTEEQRDLIKDCCDVTLPFFYQPYSSISAMPAIFERDISWIKNYAEAFAKRWQPYLADDEIIRGDIHIGASKNVIAFEFYPADQGDSWDLVPKYDQWQRILDELSEAMKIPIGTSEIIQEGIIQVVTDDSIIVIKRNEKRFWTRSLAREDADSTITQRMLGTAPHHGRLG